MRKASGFVLCSAALFAAFCAGGRAMAEVGTLGGGQAAQGLPDDGAEEQAIAAHRDVPPGWQGNVGCYYGATRNRADLDVAANQTFSRFNVARQRVSEALGAFDWCVSSRSRVRLEANLTRVWEDGRVSQSVLVGIEMPIELSPRFTMTPVARIGYEHFSFGLRNLVLNGAVVMQRAFDVRRGLAPTTLILTLRPEVTDRRIASATMPGQRSASASFSSFASTALDFGLAPRWRGAVELAGQVFTGSPLVSNVESVILSARLLTTDRQSYSLSGQIWLSRGENSYRSVLLGLSYRFSLFSRAARHRGA